MELDEPYLYDSYSSITISLDAYIVTKTDGSGGLAPEVVSAELDSMFSHFEVWNIYFDLLDIHIVSNDFLYYKYPIEYSDFENIGQYNSQSINIYFMPPDGVQPQTSSGHGGNRIIWGAGVLPLHFTSYLESGFLTHEVGHLLGLIHPFGPLPFIAYQDWPWDEHSECQYDLAMGDRVADTPESPCLSHGGDPFGLGPVVGPDCIYTPPTPVNPCDHCNPNYRDCLVEFSPDTSNFMEYTYRGCWDHFTPGQAARMSSCVIQEHVARGIAKVTYLNASYVNMSSSSHLDYAGTPYSSAVVDYDNDGLTDMFISIKDASSKLYRNDRFQEDGVPDFVDRTTASFPITPPQPGLRGVSVADYDNDGDEDIFVAAASNARLYENISDPNGGFSHFVDVSQAVGLTPFVADTWSGSWADYDNDTYLDLYVTRAQTYPGVENDNSPNASNVAPLRDYLLQNNTSTIGVFSDVSFVAEGMESSSFATIAASWADFDQDGDMDLLVPSIEHVVNYETARLYLNDGDGAFTEEFSSMFGSPDLLHISGLSWFDADNDGDLDIAFSSQMWEPYGPSQRIFIYDSGVYEEHSTGLALNATNVRSFDYDLNGTQDLLYLPSSESKSPHLLVTVPLYSNNIKYVDVTSKTGLDAAGMVNGVVVSDYNRGGGESDGDLDVYLGRQLSTQQYFYRSSCAAGGADAPVNNYLAILLKGDPSNNNTSAIGARVTISYAGQVQIQEVDGGSGRGTQDDRVLTFGLGTYAGDVDVTIVWPCGALQYEVATSGQRSSGSPMEYSDETTPLVTAGSLQVEFVHDPEDGKLDWNLLWDTNWNSKPVLDAVEIKAPGMPSGVVLIPGTATIAPNATGGFRHTLTLSDIECITGYYEFRVRCATDTVTGPWSASKTKRVAFCVSQ